MPRGIYERTKSFDVTEAPQSAKDVDANLDTPLDEIIQEVETYGNIKDFNEKAALLAFMEEPVRIFLYEGNGQNDEKSVHLQNNGENVLPGNPLLRRGMEHTIKRKFVEQLATMRPISYSQPHKGSGNDLENVFRPHVSVKYPFSVRHDANPRGPEWLKNILGK